MLKHKLPKDWIIGNSKSHPDRVYYFNVKTNQSSWVQPTDETKTSSETNRKVHEGESRGAMTSERNAEKAKETTSRRRSCDKTVETPQMKAVRAKALHTLNAKNKYSPSSPEALYEKIVGNKRKISLRSLPSKIRDDKSVTARDKNDNKVTFTPQMQVLLAKIEHRNLSTPSQNKTSKVDAKNKEESLNAANQKSTKMWEKREKNIGNRQSIARNKHNIEQCNMKQNAQELHNQNSSRERGGKSLPKKNLAKERMQRIRRNLDIDKEKFQEMYNADLVSRKASQQKFSKNLPNLSNNDCLGSRFYRNVDVRLKRLHNRILKDAVYERNVISNDKSQSQQSKGPNIQIMTKDKLIEQGKQEVLYEEMDWEPMKDEEIAFEVEVVRTQLVVKESIDIDKANCISENTAELTQPNKTESHKRGPLYIVVDTNVFLSNLDIIEQARDAVFKNYPRPFIVIPWTVICELDYFKDNKAKYELSIKARKAISFIHDQFASKHPRVIGQTREQVAKNKEDFCLTCPDDEILQCCLQISNLQKSVVLLSYDKNLCTKAMIYNIIALGRNDPLEKIDPLDEDGAVNRLNNSSVENFLFNEHLHLVDDIFEDTKLIMKNFLSTIITKQMSEIFGEVEWKIYVIIKPPWTIVTALKCAMKHWIAAINESFHRRAEYILKELHDAFVYVPVGGRKLRDVEYVIEKSSDLVQMVNADKHCDLVTQTFNALIELKKKCEKYIASIDLRKLHDKIGIAENVQEQEMRSEKAFKAFQHIYNYARDICGLACSNAGMACSFAFKSMNGALYTPSCVQRLQPEITKKVTDLTQNLNKSLVQVENSIKHQTLLSLQQNLNTFLPDIERITFDVTPLDVYYCVKLKEEALKTGLRQLQELTSHFCALATHT